MIKKNKTKLEEKQKKKPKPPRVWVKDIQVSAKKLGRPDTQLLTNEIAEEICMAMSTSSEGLSSLCRRNPHWPTRKTIHEWRIKNKSFAEMYMTAKRAQIENFVDDIIDIADDSSRDSILTEKDGVIKESFNAEYVNRSKIRIDSRKWIAARLAPKIYGDKIQSESTVTIKHEDALRELE